MRSLLNDAVLLGKVDTDERYSNEKQYKYL